MVARSGREFAVAHGAQLPAEPSRKISPALRSSGATTLALKPIEADRPRAEMIFSSPLKAPPHTNRMLVVSTCRNSCCVRSHRYDEDRPLLQVRHHAV